MIIEEAGAEWWQAPTAATSTVIPKIPRAESCSRARLLRNELLMCGGIIAPAVLEVRGLSSGDKSLRHGDLGDEASRADKHGECQLWRPLHNSDRTGHT